MTVGERVKQKRTELGWTRQRLAKETGIPVSTLATLEYGDSRTSRSVVTIAAALGVSPSWLNDGSSTADLAVTPNTLTPDERRLLFLYRALLSADKKVAVRIIRGLVAGSEP
ncbi:hypothetical protein B0E52_01770 [Rhodanobacter sp. C06]|uniref:helix-turn-helix domain-containing protein n=1 Tax=Rhodanobacter sp. C06 TaxID=1945854 RepID=UPI0009CB9DF4|nr:helix-turn-helix domain-containing protein [Rhodanobacter sp. C06]OOG48929.1 hypothetical protein B0E52_01770 [Rhodanobacter sp. C06]